MFFFSDSPRMPPQAGQTAQDQLSVQANLPQDLVGKEDSPNPSRTGLRPFHLSLLVQEGAKGQELISEERSLDALFEPSALSARWTSLPEKLIKQGVMSEADYYRRACEKPDKKFTTSMLI